mgnify:FL=1
MLEKFLKIYTVTVAVIILACLAIGLWFLFGTETSVKAYYFLFIALLASFILFVTRKMVKNMIRQNKRLPGKRKKPSED